MTKRRLLIVGAVALIAAAAVAYYQSIQAEDYPALVTAAVTRGDVVETVEATGTLQAVTTVQVGTQVSGTIKALHADFNSRVRRGQVIAELEPSLFEAQVEQARASLARLEAEAARTLVEREDAQRNLRRAQELSQAQLIPATDLEAAEMRARQAEASLKAAQAQVVQARAALNSSQVNLGHTIITAPIDGVVISRNVDVGQTVAASMQAPTLFVIARDLRAMQVNASIAESDIGPIQPGQAVTFRVDAYPEEVFSGRVSRVRLDPVVEQNVVSYITTVDVANPELKLKPGMTANVTVEIAREVNVLRVPNAALRVRLSPDVLAAFGALSPEPGTEPMAPGRPERGPAAGAPAEVPTGGRAAEIWVLADGLLRKVPVCVGITDGAHTAVLAGAVAEGARVVTGIAAQGSGSPTSGTSPLLPFGGRRPGARGAQSPSRGS